MLDWSSVVYSPIVDITKETTTLYASDRDVFLFLVDHMNPIEAGKLPEGSPDLHFKGFFCRNSEIGANTLGISSFYLRTVCQNHNLWDFEEFQEIRIRHSKYAANRFAYEAAPALTRFAGPSPRPSVGGIRAARERIVARNDDDRTDFLRKHGFSRVETVRIVETALARKVGRPKACSTSYRASPRSPDQRRCRTPGSTPHIGLDSSRPSLLFKNLLAPTQIGRDVLRLPV